MTQGRLAELTMYSLASVSAFETARRIPPPEFAAAADKALGTDGGLERLQKLVDQTSVLPWFRDRIELERNATQIREYESYQIPGLLQTEDYMRAVISAGRPAISADECERAITLRLTRQTILEPDDTMPVDRLGGMRYWAIIDASALRRTVADVKVMAGQLEHLYKLTQRPNLTIQIISDDEGVTCAYGRGFSILTAGGNGSVAYLDEIMGARYIREREGVDRFALIFDHLRSNAITDSKSAKIIREMSREYGNGVP
jgi:hypothetical protein